MAANKSSASGIVTDETGERHIPESVRADGTTRKAIKIKPGYRPPEDVEVYKNRTAETFRRRGVGPIPGAEGLSGEDKTAVPGASAAANKNAKRREARKKAKAACDTVADDEKTPGAEDTEGKKGEVDPEVEKEKKVRNLKKKLKQAKELKDKKDGGGALLPEQIAKVIKISELVRELENLGFDAEGEPKIAGKETTSKDEAAT